MIKYTLKDVTELNRLIKIAVEQQNYELAINLRDARNRITEIITSSK